MQTLYLLLRNNQQSGPYSIEELLQLQLKPFDLVWVEGRSAAWQYPGEIPALQTYVAETPRPESPFMPIATEAMEQKASGEKKPAEPAQPSIASHVFVSMPRTVRKQAAAPPIEKEMAPAPKKPEPVPEVLREDFSIAWNKNEDRISFPKKNKISDEEGWNPKLPPPKKSSFSIKDITITALIVVVIAGGYYILSRPAIITKASPEQMARKIEQAPAVATPASRTTANDQHPSQATAPTEKTEPSKLIAKAVPLKHPSKVALPTNSSSSGKEEKTNVVVVPVQTQVKEESAPVKETASAPRKKKLGEVIKNLFSKKDKKDEAKKDAPIVAEPKKETTKKTPVLEEPRPATNRQSTKRDDNATAEKEQSSEAPRGEATVSASLADQVELSSNAPESWMMGVTGLKITLHNHSATAIQTAAVNVLYYDENNRLLDKKMIYFSNIPPKGKLTLPAPDHKFADHVEFKLGAVSGKEDRYANAGN